MITTVVFLAVLLIMSSINWCIGSLDSNFLSTIFIAIISFAIIFDINTHKNTKIFRTEIIIGYLCRIALLYWDLFARNIYSLPSSGADTEHFWGVAILYSSGEKITFGVPFTTMMGTIAKLIGPSRLFLQYFNVLFSILTILVLIRCLSYIDAPYGLKKFSIIIASFLPNYAIISSIFLRESIIVLLISISLFAFFKWFFEQKQVSFFISLAFVGFATSFHSGCVGIGLGYIAVRMLFDSSLNIYRFKTRNILFGLSLFIVFAYLYFNYGEMLFGRIAGIESITDISEGIGSGGSSYAQYVGNSSSIKNMVIYTIPRFIFFMFSPFPWQWRGIRDIIAFIFSSCFYLWTVIRVIIYLRYHDGSNRNIVIALIITALSILFIFSWGVTNTGTAIRHRDKPIILYIVMWCASFNPVYVNEIYNKIDVGGNKKCAH